MDDILERAAERMKELEARQRKLQTMLADVERELAQFENFFAVASKLGAGTPAMTLMGTTAAEAANATRTVAVWPPQGRSDSWENFTRVAAGATHGSKSRVIAEAAIKIISERGPLSSRKILEALDEKGIGQTLVPGRDEKGRIGYLSAVLSKDERFVSDRDAGGYIVVAPKEETPPTGGQEGLDIKDLL